MDDQDRIWEDFTKRFKASRPSVFKVAEYLNREKNCSVYIPKMELAPNKTLAALYRDDGDIIVNDKHVIEVKGKSVLFSSAEDWPFKERDIIVANVASADRHAVFAFFIVNQHMTHAAMIRGDTKDRWKKEIMPDKRRGTWEEKYLCPIDLVEFVKL